MVMVIGGFFAAIATAVFIVLLHRRVYLRLEELGDLEWNGLLLLH